MPTQSRQARNLSGQQRTQAGGAIRNVTAGGRGKGAAARKPATTVAGRNLTYEDGLDQGFAMGQRHRARTSR